MRAQVRILNYKTRSQPSTLRRIKSTLQRKPVLLGLIIGVIFVTYLAATWPIPVQTINVETQIPRNGILGPFNEVLAVAASNSTGDVSLSVQDFKYNSPDNTTKLSASSGDIGVTITPQGQESRLSLNIQLNGVTIKSPSFTGSFSSVKLTGYVLVDPQTNKMIVSLVASTTIADILRGVIGV